MLAHVYVYMRNCVHVCMNTYAHVFLTIIISIIIFLESIYQLKLFTETQKKYVRLLNFGDLNYRCITINFLVEY